jgi:predicted metal-dependent phosphoesterase TrpH
MILVNSCAVGAIKIDLHLHTSASFDCRVSPEQVAERCRRLGLAPIVLTDHDTIAGELELRQQYPDVIAGQELMTTEGELMGLFLSRPVKGDLTPEAAVDAIKEQGGLVCLQHPYDPSRRQLWQGAIERIAPEIDLMPTRFARSVASTWRCRPSETREFLDKLRQGRIVRRKTWLA